MFPTTLYSLASSSSGVAFGALLFAGRVDCPALIDMTEKSENEAILSYFSFWFPNGAKLMLPLLSAGTLLNAGAFYLSRNRNWILAAGAHGSILLWTVLAMRKDISALLDPSTKDVGSKVRSFCTLHFVRLLIGFAGMYFSSVGYAQTTVSVLQ